MSDLLAERRIRPHQTSQRELADLLRVVDRDLADAQVAQISADRRFATAYNAALQLATIALHAAGYRAGRTAHHWVTFLALPQIMGPELQPCADYLDQCRAKRNVSDNDTIAREDDYEQVFAACPLAGRGHRPSVWWSRRRRRRGRDH